VNGGVVSHHPIWRLSVIAVMRGWGEKIAAATQIEGRALVKNFTYVFPLMQYTKDFDALR
jgi:hypothetical protein